MLPLCRRAMRARQLSAAGELPWWTWCLLASILAQEQSRQLSCPRLVALSLLFVKLVSVKISDGGRVAYSTFAARNSGLLRRSRTGRAVRAPFQHRVEVLVPSLFLESMAIAPSFSTTTHWRKQGEFRARYSLNVSVVSPLT